QHPTLAQTMGPIGEKRFFQDLVLYPFYMLRLFFTSENRTLKQD
ncbi:uncharacterized protein METZ01_LOCUS255626, partial [marine metagenome]